jgi:hypothetical protein
MRKKGNRKGKKTNRQKKYNIKKTFAFRLLIICIILLIFLIIIYIFVYEPVVSKEKFDGELGTLKWDLGYEGVYLEVLDYAIETSTNSSIEVNINWSLGNETISGILINLLGVANYCNFTEASNDLNFSDNYTYTITHSPFYCNETDFSNVTNVLAYARIHVNLTQTTIPLPEIIVYNDDDLGELLDPSDNVINFDNYFSSLVNISYSLVKDTNNDDLELTINETTNKLSLTISRDWYGSQRFNLTASEIEEGDVLNISTSGSNMSFNITIKNSTRPLSNGDPEFNDSDSNCDDLSWNKNTIYTFNMSRCWSDPENDTLTLRYENGSNEYLIINQSGEILTLTPITNYHGSGHFYIYADDGVDESGEWISFQVTDPSLPTTILTTPNITVNNTDPKIKSSIPSTNLINVNNRTQLFLITAEKYSTIKWYLNSKLLNNSGLSLNLSNLNDGDIVKVEIVNGTKIDSKTWNIKIGATNNDSTPASDDLTLGSIVFYMIIVVLVLIILLTIWVFIKSRNHKKDALNVGFGVSGGGFVGKQTPLNQFKVLKR